MSGRCEGCGYQFDWCRGFDRCLVLRYERRAETAEARVVELEAALREAVDGWDFADKTVLRFAARLGESCVFADHRIAECRRVLTGKEGA